MQSTTQQIKAPKPQLVRAYAHSAESEAGQLERLLERDGVDFIGDWSKFYEKNKLPNGDCRSAGLDMKEDDRALRTYVFKGLTLEQLYKIHGYEKSKMTRFLILSEIERILDTTIERPKWSRLLVIRLNEFGDKHRPKMTRNYKGKTIPPYFAHATFDGMIYHHEWDKLVNEFAHEFTMPILEGKSEEGF